VAVLSPKLLFREAVSGRLRQIFNDEELGNSTSIWGTVSIRCCTALYTSVVVQMSARWVTAYAAADIVRSQYPCSACNARTVSNWRLSIDGESHVCRLEWLCDELLNVALWRRGGSDQSVLVGRQRVRRLRSSHTERERDNPRFTKLLSVTLRHYCDCEHLATRTGNTTAPPTPAIAHRYGSSQHYKRSAAKKFQPRTVGWTNVSKEPTSKCSNARNAVKTNAGNNLVLDFVH